jgi:hypothetical protein
VGERGFSVLEAVIASSLLVLLAAVSLRGTLVIGTSSTSCAFTLAAVRLASSAIAAGRGSGPPGSPGSVTETVHRNGMTFDLTRRWKGSGDPALWRLVITVGWSEGGSRRNLSAETWVWSPSGA